MRPFALIAAGLFLLFGLPALPESWVAWKPWQTTERPALPAPAATAAVWVYEKDEKDVPAFVTTALDRLNRERRIVATLLEDDATNGAGAVPVQYREAIPAARRAGLPALVVLAGSTVLRVVPAPGSEAAIMEAIP